MQRYYYQTIGVIHNSLISYNPSNCVEKIKKWIDNELFIYGYEIVYILSKQNKYDNNEDYNKIIDIFSINQYIKLIIMKNPKK